MGYADLARLHAELDLVGTQADDEAEATLKKLDESMTAAFVQKCGRRWLTEGEVGVATTVIIDGVFDGGDLLLLPKPLVSLTAISIATDPVTTVATTDVLLWHRTRDGHTHALKRKAGYTWPCPEWGTPISITAMWSDEATPGPVPDDVVEAVTFLVVEQWRTNKTSPQGLIGPDLMSIRPRNPWNYEVVKTPLAKYGATVPIVGF